MILGQFKDGGIERLYSIRERLQEKGYMPMIFDFSRPDNLSLTETVVTLAGLSKFVVADLSGSSVPAELQAIFTQNKKPVLAYGDPFALFPDVADQTAVIQLEDDPAHLLDEIERKLPELETLHAERIMDLARRYQKADERRRKESHGGE